MFWLRKHSIVIVLILVAGLVFIKEQVLTRTSPAFGSTNQGIYFTIDEVYDGDTIYVSIPNIPPVLGQRIGIRLVGIDTPEMHDNDTCVRSMARVARDTLASFLIAGTKVELVNLTRDKYFRLDGDFLVDGRSAVQHMLDKSRAQKYTGTGPKPVWKCQQEWLTPTN